MDPIARHPEKKSRSRLKSKTKVRAPSQRPLVLVDDEQSYVELLAGMLSDNLSCAVHTFTRPTHALEFLSDQPAGVVVTDYFMPDMDGVEFIRRASKIVPEASFIMISGHNLEPMEYELERLKLLKERIQKPFGWKLLADAVLRVWPGADLPKLRRPKG
jgi:DNA-binding NtrC family response regulator